MVKRFLRNGKTPPERGLVVSCFVSALALVRCLLLVGEFEVLGEGIGRVPLVVNESDFSHLVLKEPFELPEELEVQGRDRLRLGRSEPWLPLEGAHDVMEHCLRVLVGRLRIRMCDVPRVIGR